MSESKRDGATVRMNPMTGGGSGAARSSGFGAAVSAAAGAGMMLTTDKERERQEAREKIAAGEQSPEVVEHGWPKILLLLVNFFFLICGVIMAGVVGVASGRTGPATDVFPASGLDGLLAAAFLLVGASVLGFYGAWAESKIALGVYVVFASMSILIELIFAIVVMVATGQITALADSTRYQEVEATLRAKALNASSAVAQVCCDSNWGVLDAEGNYAAATADTDPKEYAKLDNTAACAYANRDTWDLWGLPAWTVADNTTRVTIFKSRLAACSWISDSVFSEANCVLDGPECGYQSANAAFRDALFTDLSGVVSGVGIAVVILAVLEILGLVAACNILCRSRGKLSIFDDDVDTTLEATPQTGREPPYPLNSAPPGTAPKDRDNFWPFVLVFKNTSKKEREFMHETLLKIKEPLPQTDKPPTDPKLVPIDTCLFKSADDSEVFCKLRLHMDILHDEAFRVQYPLRVAPLELLRSDVVANQERQVFIDKLNAGEDEDARGSLTMRIPDEGSPYNPYHYIYAPYKREKHLQQMYRRDRITLTKFRQVDVIKLCVSILENRVGLVLDDLEEYFPLHDRVERLKLKDKWYKWIGSPWDQPLIPIRNYFGEKIALYFAWLGHYTKWLLTPAFVGFAVYIHQQVAGNTSVPELPFYGIFIALWATFMLEYWKRSEVKYAMMWGMTNFEEAEANRPDFDQFEGTCWSTTVRASPVSGLQETTYNTNVYNGKLVFSQWVVATMVFIVLVCVFSIFFLKSFMEGLENSGSLPTGFAAYVAAAVNAVQIQVLNVVYGKVAHQLNEWENHKTDTMYEDNLIAKTFLFQFINSYFSLFYIAFIKNNIEIAGHIGCLGNPAAVDPDLPDCLGELQSQLGVIFGTRLFVGNFTEVVLPWIISSVKRKKYEELKAQKLAEKRSPAERQNELADYETFGDHAEIAIQFGYVALFVVAFPLAPMLALVSNYVEIRVDALKVLDRSCRPEPRGAEDIGTWLVILDIMGKIAVITNLAVVMFTSNIPAFNLSESWRVWGFVIFEHGVFFLKFVFDRLIPDVPYEVQLQLDRQQYLVTKHFLGEGDVVAIRKTEQELEVELPDGINYDDPKDVQAKLHIEEDDPSPIEHEPDDVAEGADPDAPKPTSDAEPGPASAV